MESEINAASWLEFTAINVEEIPDSYYHILL